MKKLNLWALVLTLCLSVSLASASIAPIMDPISLADLEAEYNNTLHVSDKIFSGFDIFGSAIGGALAPTKEGIFVQGVIQDDLNVGVRFILTGFAAAANQAADLQLSFTVEVQERFTDLYIKDVFMRLTGATATGTGLVSANEHVADGPASDPQANDLANLDTSRQDNLSLDQLTDHEEFGPVKKIWVRKDISVSGGTAGAAALSEVFQIFSQIPEPTTLVLLGLGGLPLMLRRRKV
jgi:hypothetical protein